MTVGEEDSGSVLRAEDEAGMLTALTFKKGSGLQVGSGSDSGDKADSPVSRGGEDSDDEEEEGDETESEGEEGGEWDTNAGAKMVRRLLVHSADTDDGHGTIGIMDLPAPSPFEQPEVNPRHSSLAPWLGREVSVDALCGSSTDSALLTYATKHLQAFLQRDLPATEVLLRRQGILCDCHLVDLLTHFLDVLFLLQRAVMNTNDADMQEQYPAVPPALLQCSAHINNLLRAAVYRNEKVALKLISVQGSFMGMVSQKIMGWDPPLDLILMQTCRDSADLQGHSGVGPLDSQNQALVASSLQIAEGEAEEGEDQLDAARERERRERLGIEPILKAAISASDIRQVVEQMHLLHLRHDPTAIKIMSLLTLLCASGSAKKYLQKLLVDAIQQDDEALEGDFIQEKRSASLQTRCMLFHTQYEGQTWQVRFADAFAFSQQQGKKQHEQQVCDEELRLKLQAEGASLMSAFDRYDGDCNAVLDLCEAFCLLEDLGIGGPFLLKEVRSMEGCSAKGLGLWWCQRSSFYYPASSIAQCQLSPTQALEIMGVPMGVPTSMQVTMQAEAVRVPSSASVAERLDIPSLIAQRIPGYSLQLRDSDTYNFIDSDVFVGANPSRRKGEKLAFDMGVGVGLGVGVGFVGNAAAQARQYAVEEKRRGEDEARDAGRGGSDWIVVSDALREDCDESAWFRSSLLLLAEICKERNAYAQRIVSCLLPAECLIAVMEEDDLSFTDRSILCSLLANIYVDHMLVFPSRFSPHAGSPASPGSLSASASQSPSNTHSANMYLGYDEEVLNPEVTIGKLFNSQSRTRFLGEAVPLLPHHYH
ncbi:hypothetical protein B484DRAFT_91689 [Ochromonadaceae sp. CCMP2298]|nr:hypothetical protein B484DRAFT_91689 [Ochromonadaceae sp. CCMP2298]